MKTICFGIGMLMLALSIPTVASATLIAYEPFLHDPANPDNAAPDASAGQYVVDVDIKTQSPSPTVLGFTGDWSGTTSAFEASRFTLPTNVAPIAGGRVFWPGAASEVDRNIERDLVDYSGNASNTYYLSVVSRRNSWSGEQAYIDAGATLAPEVFLGMTNDAKDEGVFIGYGFRGDATNTTFPSLVVRAGGVDHLASGNDSTFGDVFTTVMKLEMDVSGSQDRLSWYTRLGAGAAGDFDTEALAAANADFQNIITADIVSSQTVISELNITSPTHSGTVYFDEVRFATTWNEAVGIPVPEPSSIALIGLSLAGLAAARRRRR